MRRTITTLTALALVVSACGSGAADDDRNVAIPGAGTLAQLLPQGVAFAPDQTAAVAIGGNESSTCMIDHVGGLWCWGRRRSNLANPQPVDVATSPVKVRIGNDLRVTAVSSGDSETTCVVADTKVWCWGLNVSRTVDPKNSASYVSSPVAVQGIPEPVIDVATTQSTSCAVTAAGRVWCWGDGRNFGFGQAAASNYAVSGPLDMGVALGATKIATGDNTTCIVNGLSELWCWGRNRFGQAGTGNYQPVFVPTKVNLGGSVVSVSLTINHVCAVLLDGNVKCWGRNQSFEVGYSDNSVTLVNPTGVTGLGAVGVMVATLSGSTCLVDSSAKLLCWGRYPGTSNQWYLKREIAGMTDIMGLSSTYLGTVCAVTWKGEITCVGSDDNGALGNGDVSTTAVSAGQRIGGFGIAEVAIPTTLPAPTSTSVAPSTTQGGGVTVVTIMPINPSTLPPPTTVVNAGGGTNIVQTTVNPTSTAPVQSTAPTTSVPVVCCPPDGGFASPDSAEVKLPAVSAANETRRVLTIRVGKSLAESAVARFAGLAVPKGAKLSVSIAKSSKRNCARNGSRVTGARPGTCRVTVKMTPKGGKTLVRIVNAQVVR